MKQLNFAHKMWRTDKIPRPLFFYTIVLNIGTMSNALQHADYTEYL